MPQIINAPGMDGNAPKIEATTGNARFIVDPNGTAVDTGTSYIHPGYSNTNPNTGQTYTGASYNVNEVSFEDIQNITEGTAELV